MECGQDLKKREEEYGSAQKCSVTVFLGLSLLSEGIGL